LVEKLSRLSGLRGMLAFLTIFPVGKVTGSLAEWSGVWFLSPIVGALVGTISGVVALALSRVFPSLVVAPIAFGLIVLITGGHHLDGLLDFGDALMAHGNPERKIEIMHDNLLGAGGFALGLLVPITTISCIASLKPELVAQAIAVSEISAKLSMVVATRFGKEIDQGTGTIVVHAMHQRNASAKLLASMTISWVFAGFFFGYAGLLATASSIVSSLAIAGISNRQFKGVTGDALGATNEISRMIFLLALLAIIA
jgi:adenosylcobinamide-GDP ribazoletransferase